MKYISLQKSSEERFRNDYINQHARFIHSSWLLSEDLDKEVELYGKKFRIAGLWDTVGYKKIILLNNLEVETSYGFTDSQEVANALGFTKFRNFVTGKEITYDLAAEAKAREWLNKQKIAETPIVQSDDDEDLDEAVITNDEDLDEVILERDKEYVNEDDEDDEDATEIDPLVKALQIDEDDSGWINDND
jgi:hypothetical protein